MRIVLTLILVLMLASFAYADVLSDLTQGILSCPATTDVVSHWSLLKGDFGGGAGFGLLSVKGFPATLEATGVGFQTRQTAGFDIICPLYGDMFSPLVKSLDLGGYAGWNYQANIQDNYSDLKWLGFDWGLSIVKKF